MTDLQHDIEKYLRGELSPAEMHALEKKALDDPFLADALEGAESIGAQAFHADLADLSHRFQQRIEPESRTTVAIFWKWTARIAAGLLMLTLATYVLNMIVAKQALKRESMASMMTIQPGTDTLNIYLPPAYERYSGTPTIASASGGGSSRYVSASEGQYIRNNELSVEANLMTSEELQEAVSENAPAARPSKRLARREPANVTPSTRSSVAAVAPADSVVISAEPTSLVARGRVLAAEDGSALPGIAVVVKGTSTGTITDAEGYFEVPVYAQNTTLQLAFVGLASKEVEVTAGSDVQVEMSSDMASLSEVVVAGHEKYRAKTTTTTEPAAPDGGNKAFNDYIEQSLKYPDQAIENNIEGRVTVEFTVEPSGQLSDFKILKGLGYGCDEEAIRLIKQGPKWIPARRTTEPVREHVKVRLKFALPRQNKK